MTEDPSNPIIHKEIPPGLQFFILLGLLIATLFVGSFIGGAIVIARYGMDTFTAIMQSKLSAPHVVTALWILQFTGTTFPILVSPLIFSYRIVREPDDYLKNHFHFPFTLIIVVILTMMISMPLIEFLGNANARMVLPKFLKGLEDWMKQSENDAQKMSDVMMQMNSVWSMIYDLLFIGLLTAVVEEILFRGCFQTIFYRWFKGNIHAAVWAAAILFSALHLEFYGFVPRLVLGVLFGYFAAWSGSIWPAILAHFVNNGTIVVWTFLYQSKATAVNPDQPQFFNGTGYIVSFLATILFLGIYWYISNKWHTVHHGEELD